MLNQQTGQMKHQMIARINKDFVPACRYGLGGLHDGEHVQLPSCPNSALARPHRVRASDFGKRRVLHTGN